MQLSNTLPIYFLFLAFTAAIPVEAANATSVAASSAIPSDVAAEPEVILTTRVAEICSNCTEHGITALYDPIDWSDISA